MGSGRARAKQAKVARELKYNSPKTDLASLQRELARAQRGETDTQTDEYTDDYFEARSRD